MDEEKSKQFCFAQKLYSGLTFTKIKQITVCLQALRHSKSNKTNGTLDKELNIQNLNIIIIKYLIRKETKMNCLSSVNVFSIHCTKSKNASDAIRSVYR